MGNKGGKEAEPAPVASQHSGSPAKPARSPHAAQSNSSPARSGGNRSDRSLGKRRDHGNAGEGGGSQRQLAQGRHGGGNGNNGGSGRSSGSRRHDAEARPGGGGGGGSPGYSASQRRGEQQGSRRGLQGSGSVHNDSLNLDVGADAVGGSPSSASTAAASSDRSYQDSMRAQRQAQEQRQQQLLQQQKSERRRQRHAAMKKQQEEQERLAAQRSARDADLRAKREALAAQRAEAAKPKPTRDMAGTTVFSTPQPATTPERTSTFDNERFRKANSSKRTGGSTRTFRPTFAARQAAYNSNTFSLHSAAHNGFARATGGGADPQVPVNSTLSTTSTPSKALPEHPETDVGSRTVMTDVDEDLMDAILNDDF